MHHREVHRTVKEAQWWKRLRIDPLITAETLWLKTHPRTPVDDANEVDEGIGSTSPATPTAPGPEAPSRNVNSETNPIAD